MEGKQNEKLAPVYPVKMVNERPWLEDFFHYVRIKMKKGQQEHSDLSLVLKPSQLIEELQAECLDLAGWGSILWMRLNKMLVAAKRLEAMVDASPQPPAALPPPASSTPE